MGNPQGGPPNKFPQWVYLGDCNTAADKAVKLSIAYELFYQTYGTWPTVAINDQGTVFLGAYGHDKK